MINESVPLIKPQTWGKWRRNSVKNVALIANPFLRPAWGIQAHTTAAPRARAFREASVDDFLDYIYIGLKTYQAYWKPYGTNPFSIFFPFATRLEVGNIIYNDPRPNRPEMVTYTVKALLKNAGINVVLLDGPVAPVVGDVLRFDESRGDLLQFNVGYPNSEETHFYFDEKTQKENASKPWKDTITYRILRTEPAGVRDLFGEPKEYRPRRLETKYEYQENRNVEYRVQSFDSLIQFDCWTMTNEDSEALASWFRYFVNLYTPIFLENGVGQVIFLGKLQDIHVTRWRNDIIARSIQYGVRTQEVTCYDVGVIHSVHASFTAGLEEWGSNMESIDVLIDDTPTPSNDLTVHI